MAGAACHIRAGRPAGVVVLATSVSGVRISWEATGGSSVSGFREAVGGSSV